MRKIAIFVLSLVLCLSLCPISVFAADESFVLKLHIGEQATITMPSAPSHTLPTPDAPEGKVFAGWYAAATDDATAVFLPAGATVTKDIAVELTALFISMNTRSDAELRIVEGDEGVRFVTDINRDDMELLTAQTTVLSMGTLIIREESHMLITGPYWGAITGGVVSHDTLRMLVSPYNKYLDVVTTGPYSETRRTYSIAGSVSHIPSKKLYSGFVGVGYLQLAYTDGSTGYVYANFDTEGETKLYSLAAEAFGDRANERDDTYPYKTSAGYSPYTDSQLAFMKGVLDRVVNLTFVEKDGATVPVILPNIPAYTAPYVIVSSRFSVEFEYYLLVAQGDYRFDEDFAILLNNGEKCFVYNGTRTGICDVDPQNDGKTMAVDFKGDRGEL